MSRRMRLTLPLGSVVLAMTLSARAVAEDQTYHPSAWVNNPFNPNPNFGVQNADSFSPTYTNNGYHLGTLYGDSPIGAELRLADPGDTITLRGRVTLTGEINPDGNMQFRVGLYYRGDSAADTNWLGYMIGNPVNVGVDSVPTGLYIRNNPNPGIYASGSAGNAMRPKPRSQSCSQGWSGGTYDFFLSVRQLSAEAQKISWQLAGVVPNTYNYSGAFTNTFAVTCPPAFDRVGFLSGAGLFLSASKETSVDFEDLTVTLQKGAISQ